jgi:uncharacterized protein (TIGR03435 family)
MSKARLVSIALAVAAGILDASAGQFEVASIRVNRSGMNGGGIGNTAGGRLVARNQSVEDLVRFAYGLEFTIEGLVSGVPDSVRSERYDIEAKAGGNPNQKQMQSMMRALLEDRFKLKAHPQSKQLSVYALVVANRNGKLGPKVRPASTDESRFCDSFDAATEPAHPDYDAEGNRRCSASGRGGMTFRARPLSDVAGMLAELVGRPVIDRTGLKGRYDIDLKATLDWDHVVTAGPSDTVGVNSVIFVELQEQLGFKLESTRASVETIVIDSVQPASEN